MWALGDYAQVAARIEPMAADLLDEVERRDGPLASQGVVDVACGTGNVALEAARRGAVVSGLDLTAALVLEARRRAEREVLDVRWVVGDLASPAVADRVAPEGVEVVTSCLGHVFVPDHQQCVASVAHLLRPGGLFGYVSWVPWPGDPTAAPLAPYVSVCTPDRAPTAWGLPHVAAARLSPYFEEVRWREREHPWAFVSPAAAAAWFLERSPVHAAVVAGLSPAWRASLRGALVDAFEAVVADDGWVRWRAPYLVVTARRR